MRSEDKIQKCQTVYIPKSLSYLSLHTKTKEGTGMFSDEPFCLGRIHSLMHLQDVKSQKIFVLVLFVKYYWNGSNFVTCLHLYLGLMQNLLRTSVLHFIY